MKETFDLIKSVLEVGKTVADNLFSKKLTKEDIEAIVAKYHIPEPKIVEKIFIVINENQDLTYTDTGQIIIKNNDIDKLKFQQLFLQMLMKQMENKREVEWEDVDIIPKVQDDIKQTKNALTAETQKLTLAEEQEMIYKIRVKHKELYGE